MTAGQKMRELRGERTKQEIADAIGISVSAYIKYERDERVPRDDVKRLIAKHFNVSVASIFFA